MSAPTPDRPAPNWYKGKIADLTETASPVLWTFRKATNGAPDYHVIGPSGGCIARTSEEKYARLIAQAPALREMVAKLVLIADLDRGSNDFYDAFSEFTGEARALLAQLDKAQIEKERP